MDLDGHEGDIWLSSGLLSYLNLCIPLTLRGRVSGTLLVTSRTAAMYIKQGPTSVTLLIPSAWITIPYPWKSDLPDLSQPSPLSPDPETEDRKAAEHN